MPARLDLKLFTNMFFERVAPTGPFHGSSCNWLPDSSSLAAFSPFVYLAVPVSLGLTASEPGPEGETVEETPPRGRYALSLWIRDTSAVESSEAEVLRYSSLVFVVVKELFLRGMALDRGVTCDCSRLRYCG